MAARVSARRALKSVSSTPRLTERGSPSHAASAPAAAAGARPGTRGVDPVGRRREDGDGIRPHEPLTGAGLRDAGEDALAGDRVADEEHLSLVPGHAVAAVGDGRDVDLHLGTDGQAGPVPVGGHCLHGDAL